MSRTEKTREVIRNLKLVRDEQGLSVQRITDMLEERGTPVSLATVRRVFDEGSEERNFRYEDSIKPIADLLLDIQSKSTPSGADAAELEALRALVRYKNSYIAELEAAASNVDAKVQAAKDEAQRKIDFLREQIAFKEEQMKAKDQQLLDRGKLLDERRDFLYRKDKTIALLAVLLAVCVVLIFTALVIDSLNPNMGFFWLDDMAARIFNNLHGGSPGSFGVNL